MQFGWVRSQDDNGVEYPVAVMPGVTWFFAEPGRPDIGNLEILTLLVTVLYEDWCYSNEPDEAPVWDGLLIKNCSTCVPSWNRGG